MSAVAVAVGAGVSAAAAIGTGVASSQAQSSAAGKAAQQAGLASAQQSSTNALTTTQARSDFGPYIGTGQAANATLAGLLGLLTPDSLQPPDLSAYQTPVFIGGKYQYITNQEAYDQAMQAYSAQKAQLQQLEQRGQLGQLLQPYGMEQYKNDPGYTPMVQTLEDLQATPGYQFQLQQGQQSALNSAAAKGSLLSGGTLKSLERFGQGLASTSFQNAWERAQTAYQNAFNRNTTNQNNMFARLSGLAGQGLNAVQGATGTAVSLTGMQNQNLQNNSNAQQQAAYQQGQAQSNMYGAINQGIQGLTGNYLTAQSLAQPSQPAQSGTGPARFSFALGG